MRVFVLLVVACGSNTNGTDNQGKVTPKPIEPMQTVRDSTDTVARIYLTFDDGPYITTPSVLKVLKDKGIRSSFFIVGAQIKASGWHDSVYHSLAAYTNVRVYNHTFSHAVTNGRISNYYKHPKSVWLDIEKNKALLPPGTSITRLPGKNTWRTPERTSKWEPQAGPLLSFLDSMKQPEFIVGWDFEWTAACSKDPGSLNSLIRQVDKKMALLPAHRRDVVILSHDYLFRTDQSLQMLSAFIDTMNARKNLKFDWVHHLPGLESGLGLEVSNRGKE